MKSSIKIKGKLRKYIYMPMMLTILLVMFNGALYIKDLSVGAMFSVFIIFYVVVLLLFYRKYRPKLAQEMVNFATQYGTVQKKLLSEFEIPYALLDYNAKIMWCNEQFMKVTGINKDYHKSISAILPSLTKEIIQKTTPVDSMNMTLEERNYRVSMRRLYFEELTEGSGILDGSESSEYLTAVYLFDETEINRYIKENREQKLVAGLVYIDNYEEALDSIEDVKRSLLVALIDRKVNKYFSEIDALVRKIEKDKYFVVFRYKYLEQLKADKFSLIEDVKTVKVGNEMAVTLSIGLGAEGTGYNQNYEYARMSIDLALGRGGDQVVLKEGEEVSYYGGKTQQVEKNTRVKARVKAHALREIIEIR